MMTEKQWQGFNLAGVNIVNSCAAKCPNPESSDVQVACMATIATLVTYLASVGIVPEETAAKLIADVPNHLTPTDTRKFMEMIGTWDQGAWIEAIRDVVNSN